MSTAISASMPGRLAKSLLASIIASWLGLTPVVTFEQMRLQTYLLTTPEDYSRWFLGGALTAGHVLLSVFPIYVLIPMLVIGLPLQALLQRFGKVGYLWLVVPAIVIGPLLLASLFVIFANLLRGSLNPYALILTAVGAFLTTTIFWLIRRPDKDVVVTP